MEVTALGNIVNRYKVNELAKDFGMQTKRIIEILGQYFDTPKKSGQNLDDQELAVVFEYLTQNNQISSIQDIYADAAAEKAKPAQPEKDKGRGVQQQGAQPQKPQAAGQPQSAGKGQNAPKAGGQRPQQAAQPQAQQQKAAAQPTSRVPKTKVVDTRKATNVNLDK